MLRDVRRHEILDKKVLAAMQMKVGRDTGGVGESLGDIWTAR